MITKEEKLQYLLSGRVVFPLLRDTFNRPIDSTENMWNEEVGENLKNQIFVLMFTA